MAFFGLTALGSQNCFSQADCRTRNLHIFDIHDFQKAWITAIGPDDKVAEVSRIGDIMKSLFRGPVPPRDQYAVMNIGAQVIRSIKRFSSTSTAMHLMLISIDCHLQKMIILMPF